MLQYLIFCNVVCSVSSCSCSLSGALQIIYEQGIADGFFFFFSFFDFSYLECVNVIGYSGLKFGDLNLELISKHLTVSGKQLTW